MRKIKRLFLFLLTLVVCFNVCFALVACGGGDDDDGRTKIYVGIYNGGIGKEWLDEMGKEFSKTHPDYVIKPVPDKDIYAYTTLYTSMPKNVQEIYFVDSLTYYDYIRKDVLMDITDIVTDTSRVGGSLESIMEPAYVDFLNVENKYYALPYYDDTFQMSFDVDVFENNDCFISKIDSKGNIMEWTGKGEKHVGQDGVPGTSDDGLPISYSQFFKLLERLRNKGITPITWNGANYSIYINKLMSSIAAQYDGVDNTAAIYGKGIKEGYTTKIIDQFKKDHIAGSFDGSEFTTKEVTINWDNYENIYYTPGQYFAMCFIRDIVANQKNYDSLALSPSDSHLDAQERFLYSSYLDNPIAMFFDGGWWENEADAIFKDMAADFGPDYSRLNRRFGVMTMPLSDEVYANGDYDASKYQYVYTPYSSSSLAFISKTAQHPEIAKEFLAFCYNNQNMSLFTTITGDTRAFKYDMSGSMSKLSSYTKARIEKYSADNVVRIGRFEAVEELKNPDYGFMNWVMNCQFITDKGEGYSQSIVDTFFNFPNCNIQEYYKGSITAHKTSVDKLRAKFTF